MVIMWVPWKLHPEPRLVSSINNKNHCILVFALFSKFTLCKNETMKKGVTWFPWRAQNELPEQIAGNEHCIQQAPGF